MTQALQKTVDGGGAVSAAQVNELRALTSEERVKVLNGLKTWPDVQKLGRKIAAHPEEAGGLVGQILNEDVRTDPKIAGALANRLILGVRDRGGNGHDDVYREIEEQLAGGDVTEPSKRQRAAKKLSVLPSSTLDVMYESHYRGNTDTDARSESPIVPVHGHRAPSSPCASTT